MEQNYRTVCLNLNVFFLAQFFISFTCFSYGHWTAPEYYEMARETLNENVQKKQKEESLERRREKLRKLLADEQRTFEEEIKSLKANLFQLKKKIENKTTFTDAERAKANKISTEMLKSIRETQQRTEEEKRRLELEARLYKRWRYGFCEDSVLLDARSDHEALAKMNWMDKQVRQRLENSRMNFDSNYFRFSDFKSNRTRKGGQRIGRAKAPSARRDTEARRIAQCTKANAIERNQ